MSAYHQLGHNSWNLVEKKEEEIGPFGGLVLSPVNSPPDEVIDRLKRLGAAKRASMEVILDPQLYDPRHERGVLSEWSHFPSDFETADRSDPRWWMRQGASVVGAAIEVGANAVCSPAFKATRFSDEYYRMIVDVADATKVEADQSNLSTLVTAIVSLRDLAAPNRAKEIATILTGSNCDRVYLAFLTEEIGMREHLSDFDELSNAVQLIRLLSLAGIRVHVGFCAFDAVLWKAAGAVDISSGKFLNLRRFSPARWEEEGAKTTKTTRTYWTEPSLLTLLREADVVRLQRAGLLSPESLEANPSSKEILHALMSGGGAKWQSKSWSQYLRWLSNTDAAISSLADGEAVLEASIESWRAVRTARIQLTDVENDGSHAATWLNVLRDAGSL